MKRILTQEHRQEVNPVGKDSFYNRIEE